MNRKQLSLKCFLLLLTSALFFTIFSLNLQQYNKAMAYLEERNEVYFRFWVDEIPYFEDTHDNLSIDDIKDGMAYAYANTQHFQKFLDHSVDFEVLVPPGDEAGEMETSDYKDFFLKEKRIIDKYPSFGGYLELLNGFQEKYPNLCQVREIGKSVSNRQIMLVKLSDNVTKEEAEPKFFSTGNIHGDETEGFILNLKMLDYMLTNYGSDEQVTRILDNIQVYFAPSVNPDGLYRNNNSSVSNPRRSNDNGADLNRSFKCKCGKGPNKQPETMSLIKFAEENVSIVNYIDFHGGTRVLLYPFSCDRTTVVDKPWWSKVMGEFCETANDAAGHNYMSYKQAFLLYNRPTHGTTKDYWTYQRPSRGCTMEQWSTKTIPERDFTKYWNYNRQAYLDYIEQTRFGIAGIVKDAATGKVLSAKVTIEKHDKDNSWMVTEPKTGFYQRPIIAGTYDVTFTSDGYNPRTYENVKVENNKTTVLNADLTNPSNIELFSQLNVSGISVVKVPRGIMIRNSQKIKGNFQAAIYDISGKLIKELSQQDLIGNQDYVWNGVNSRGVQVSNGCYLLHFSLNNQTVNQRFTLTR